jgi:predicted acylesterase/phospholipase RssA
MLDRLAADAEHVLLVADGTPQWRAFCLRDADRILAVTSGTPDRNVPRDVVGCELVALDVPVGSGALSEVADVLRPHGTHVVRAATLDEDCARLARRLTGRSVGLVLSGGGARALAHIGVIAELQAAGITIDRIAGVSMGALIGGLFALGMDAEEIDARCYCDWVRRRPLGDYTLPRRSLIRGDRVKTLIAEACGPAHIEELARAFFCQSVDIRDGETVVHAHGPLHSAIAASMCVPLLGPPQRHGGRLLVDGGVRDNLPAARMALAGEGPVIAVDAGPPTSTGDGSPGLYVTLVRVMALGAADTRATAALHADLVVRPQTDGIGIFEFHQLDRAVAAGRRAAAQALASAA